MFLFFSSDISSSTSPVRGGPPSPIELSPQSVPLLPHASANNRENAAGVAVGPNFSPLKIGNVLSNQKPLLKLQPHQGSNPCQERNLCPAASGSSSSSDTDGLVQRSSKDPPVPRARRDSEESVAADASGLRPLEPTFVAAPISYLQNDFSALESTGAAAGASGRSASAKNKKNEQHAKQIGKLKQSNSSSNSGASVHNVTAAPPPPHFQDLSKSNLLRARDLQAAVSQPQLRVRNEEASTLGPNININRGNETTGRNLAEDQSLSV